MTKIQQKIETLPFNKYFIDSCKFLIDRDKFTDVHIPSSFTLIDNETGEELNNFKKSSLEVPYRGHKIYIATVKKQLKQMFVDKILIYYSAKVEGCKYFYGITKLSIIDVLEHLKSIGYINYNHVESIYSEIYVKDLDIKNDRKLNPTDREDIITYNKFFQERFNGEIRDFHSFNSQKQGFGITTYERASGTIVKPFLKFYDKSLEMTTKNSEFMKSLPDGLRNTILFNFIYRYEFTLRNKSYFTKFGISNRLKDIHNVPQEKWSEIGKYFLDANFQVKINKPRDMSKLRPQEMIMCFYLNEDIEKGLSMSEIRDKYVTIQRDKKSKYRMKLLFERIYYFATVGKVKEVEDAKERYELIKKWDKVFGF